MPVVAVVAGVSAISAGAALTGVIGGIMIAGGAMSIVGAVTGNQDMMKIGALASMGAGIASWAGVGAAGASATAGEAAAGVAGNAAGEAAGAGVADQVAASSASGFGGAGMDPSVMGAGTDMSAGLIGSKAVGFGGVGTDASVMGTAGAPTGLAESAMPNVGVSNAGYVAPVGLPSTSSGFGGVGTDAATGFTSTPSALGSFGAKALDFMKSNPEATKLGSSLIGGAMDSYGKQSLLDQQMAQRRAEIQQQIDLEAQQRARYNASITGQRG